MAGWILKEKLKDNLEWINDAGTASESENAARQQHKKILYSRTKVLSSERQTHGAAEKDKNGNILSDKESKTNRWYEYFNEVLNRENPSNPISIPEIEAPDEIEEVDASEPTRAEIKEVKKNTQKMKKLVSTTYEQGFSKLTLTLRR